MMGNYHVPFWRAAALVRESLTLIAVSLFSGVGGLDLGVKQAGFEVKAAIEIDPIHAETHAANFPDTLMLNTSVVSVTGEHILEITKSPVDLLFGGSPCQDFSINGKRQFGSRGALIWDFVELIRQIKPKYFIFENVPGLSQGQLKPLFGMFLVRCQEAGYQVSHGILNAKDYLVPQDRERLFVFGTRNGLPMPNFPTPIRGQTTVRNAIADLPSPTSAGFRPYSCLRTPSTYVEKLNFGYPAPEFITAIQETKHSPEVQERFRCTFPGEREPISRFLRLHPDRVSPTLRAGTPSERGSHTAPRPIHYNCDRVITPREAARLHSFPDWFQFANTKWYQLMQIGNSVPPWLARAVASQFFEVLR
jgi:DNA (cytosine-5)-methyltransferase 1